MPTRTQIIACWALFTGAMALLSWLLHEIVPPTMSTLQGAVGIVPLGVVMFVAWCVAAYFGWGPSIRAALARRRQAAIRQR